METIKNIKKIAIFEKISFDQYYKDANELFALDKLTEAMHATEEDMRAIQKMIYSDIKLPERGTAGSAGYDFRSTAKFELNPGESIVLPTGIRCKMEAGWVLLVAPRSGLGFKYHMVLDNTVGVIDSDYYYSDNEGHIKVKITNMGKKPMSVNEGDKIVQGIFVPFGVTYDDKATEVRNGGFGSTGA